VSRPIAPSYKTTNWPARNEAPNRRGFLTLKVLFDLPLRQTVELVESSIRMAGLD